MIRYTICKTLFAAAALALTACSVPDTGQETAEWWVTDPEAGVLFERREDDLRFEEMDPEVTGEQEPVIEVNEGETFQEIDGFGFTLTGGSAMHLIGMSPEARAALLRELFGTAGNAIGISYLRLSIGASDLNESAFSYDDLPEGETDPQMEHFDLGPDRENVIPVLKEILAVNPDIKLMGSPWSPPAWMKTNRDTRGGSLKPEWYDAYARYFVKYIGQMQEEGIRIDAVTVQNEPLHPGNNPSLLMEAPEQAVFVRDHLGPAFEAAGIDTKIIIYDHNADRPDYPVSILNDPEAKKYIDGSAFHLYAGEIGALSEVHNAHPDRNLYFTEQWMGAPGNLKEDLAHHIKHLTIGATRNWCRTVLEWNLSSDPAYQPHTGRGGCDRCLGGVTIDGNHVTRNPAYYVVAHASKFVRPGSVRIASGYLETLPNVAFKTPEGKKVVIIFNDSGSPQTFHIRYKDQVAASALNAGAVGTYVWE